jgi:hypothetical protein
MTTPPSSPLTSDALWDRVDIAKVALASHHRLPVKLLVACGVTVAATFAITLTTLRSGDYGPKGTDATSVVLVLGGGVLAILLVLMVVHGARSLLLAMRTLSDVNELEVRGEARARDGARAPYLLATRKELRERAVPQSVLWLALGLAALAKVVPFVWAAGRE